MLDATFILFLQSVLFNFINVLQSQFLVTSILNLYFKYSSYIILQFSILSSKKSALFIFTIKKLTFD